MNKKSAKSKEWLFTVLGIVLGISVMVVLFLTNTTHSVALEQKIRCGMEEHAHADKCYSGDVLTCTVPEHYHDKNCYLVLSDENDVNSVISEMDEDNESSLDDFIDDVVNSAMDLNGSMDNFGDESSEGNLEDISYDKSTVKKLNDTIASEDSIPNLMLNENINTVKTASESKAVSTTDNIELPSKTENSGSQTLSVGDTPSANANDANLYVYLDNSWQCIGTIGFTNIRSGWNYVSTAENTDILNLINNSLQTEFTMNSFRLFYDTSPTSYSWTRASIGTSTTTFGSSRYQQTASRAKYVRVVSNRATSGSDTSLAFYTVTFEYPNGATEKMYVQSGKSITLPEGYTWTDSDGNTYESGEQVTINKRTAFTGEMAGPITSINIIYDINFPTISGVTVNTKPTISGTTASTLTENITQGRGTTIRNVSQRNVKGKVNGNTTGLSRIVHFKGWKVNDSQVMLNPNTTLTWDELLEYQTSRKIRLTAVWEYDPLQTASFFMRYDSVAVDTEGGIVGQPSEKYTPELFASYVGGVDLSLSVNELDNLYHIADTTADNSYTADATIRNLYGARADGVWLQSFPKDDDIFEMLKQYAEHLEVDGKPVDVNDLNSNAYAIRWYVFKCQSDAWHIDGKLVAKERIIDVSKTFAGNAQLISQQKAGFYIDAYNENDKTHTTLDLSNRTNYNPLTQTYSWELKGFEYGDKIMLTEYPGQIKSDDFNVYSEYTVIDSEDKQSKQGAGQTVNVTGVACAIDNRENEFLRVHFTNIYNRSDSIIIKKQDSRTGASISGAKFMLLQNDVPLKFDFDTNTNSYKYNPESGAYTTLDGNETGYFEISIEDFSYDQGAITVREVASPSGYAMVNDIVIGYTDNTKKTIGIIDGDSELVNYVKGILIVSNSSDVTSVTVKKEWECSESEWDDVEMQLLANKKLITTMLSGVSPTVTLNNDCNWTYTWNNLPVYIDGEKVDYSVREIRIGDEQCKSDYSFVNWLASYDPSVTTIDGAGNRNVLLNVTNTTKRVLLRLTKMDEDMATRLSDATFLLEEEEGGISKTLTTGSNGTLVFDNLKCNIRYRLTETNPPDGYIRVEEPIYFTINEDGTVIVEDHTYAIAGTSAFNIIVTNQKALPLPGTGGGGNLIYLACGILIMGAALALIIIKLRRKRHLNQL